MYIYNKSLGRLMLVLAMSSLCVSCSEDWRDLPEVSPSDYEGKIEGFDSSDQVQPDHLVAYWNFNDGMAETKTGTKPTSSANASLVDGGVTGKALKLDAGYLYYAKQFPMFDTTFKSFTISEWVQVQNNGSTNTMSFMLARPGEYRGYINFMLETSHYPGSYTDGLIIHPRYVDKNGGTQDNVNAWWIENVKAPANPPDEWIHLVLTYNFSYEGNNSFHIWANGEDIGSYTNRGENYFACNKPNEVLIGTWYSELPGNSVTLPGGVKPGLMTGKIDEIRVYNIALGTADVIALYKLGRAGK